MRSFVGIGDKNECLGFASASDGYRGYRLTDSLRLSTCVTRLVRSYQSDPKMLCGGSQQIWLCLGETRILPSPACPRWESSVTLRRAGLVQQRWNMTTDLREGVVRLTCGGRDLGGNRAGIDRAQQTKFCSRVEMDPVRYVSADFA